MLMSNLVIMVSPISVPMLTVWSIRNRTSGISVEFPTDVAICVRPDETRHGGADPDAYQQTRQHVARIMRKKQNARSGKSGKAGTKE
jgi:hypothetical protein